MCNVPTESWNSTQNRAVTVLVLVNVIASILIQCLFLFLVHIIVSTHTHVLRAWVHFLGWAIVCVCVCVCACVCVHTLSHIHLFATPWTIAHQAPLVHGIFQARILKWVAISFSRGSSWPRDRTHVSCVSCTDKQVLFLFVFWQAGYLPLHHLGSSRWATISKIIFTLEILNICSYYSLMETASHVREDYFIM